MSARGQCVKCGGAVHVITVDRFGSTIPVGFFGNAKLDHHVCSQCGYVESYVNEAEARAKIAANFPVAT
jgi:predicted nucleic-acid-binding Zn-ribbon protein